MAHKVRTNKRQFETTWLVNLPGKGGMVPEGVVIKKPS